MASHGRPKVRDLSRKSPSHEEKRALYETFREGPPIVTAILGQALIEIELETLLRTKFKRKDDSDWARLTGENGPLGTFYAKIIAGYAFGLYDDSTLANINTIRDIRNAFAHSKRPIDFDEKVIVDALTNSKLKNKKYSKYNKIISRVRSQKYNARDSFIRLCEVSYLELLKCVARHDNATYRNLKRSSMKANPLFSLLNPDLRSLANSLQSSSRNQISDPIGQAQGPLTLRSPEIPHKKSRTEDK